MECGYCEHDIRGGHADDCPKHELIKYRSALQEIIDSSDDFAADPEKWSSTIAKKALGWTFKAGKSYPPKS